MRSINRLGLFATLVLSSAAAFATIGPHANNVTLVNDSQATIVAVSDGYQAINLGQSAKNFPIGAKQDIALNRANGCRVTLTVTFADGSTAIQPKFNACRSASFDLKS